MKCPYCDGHMEHKVDYIPMSQKKRDVLNFILVGGPRGVKVSEIKKNFFKPTNSDISVRTLINGLNSKIKPLRVYTRNGITRLTR